MPSRIREFWARLLFLILFLHIGCGSVLHERTKPISEFKGPKPGPAGVHLYFGSDAQKAAANEAFFIMPLAVREAILIADLVDEKKLGKNILGVCAHDGQVRILLQDVSNPKSRLEFQETVWHETAHAYMFKIEKKLNKIGQSFAIEWTRISGHKAYKGSGWRYTKGLPHNGFWTAYSYQDAWEHVAECVMECYKFIAGHTKEDGLKHVFYRIRKNDQKSILYLNLLLKHKFITGEHYKKIAPLLKK